MRRSAVLWLGLCLLMAEAVADGKFYVSERLPAIPYQRAVIWHDGSYQTMLLQSKYEIPGGSAPTDFGWVVPVPAIPDIATADAHTARALFQELTAATEPEVVFLSAKLVSIIGLLLLARLVWAVAARASVRSGRGRRTIGTVRGNLGLLALWVPAYLLFGLGGGDDLAARKSAPAVRVVKEVTAGNYEVKVVQSRDAAALVGWLTERRYRFDRRDEQTFAAYIAKGWSFVAARQVAKSQEGPGRASQLADPLILGFATEEPVYPLALTATIGQTTRIRLYVLRDGRTDAGNRLEAVHAGPLQSGLEWVAERLTPSDTFPRKRLSARFVTRLEGDLTPPQMADDLVLQRASDNQPRRRTTHTWASPLYWDYTQSLRANRE